jgi:hypothetical protein
MHVRSRATTVLALVLSTHAAAAQTKEECASAANTAQTLRDAGKYLAARAALVTCASAACPAVVGDSCRSWLAEVDSEMPSVVFSVKDEHGRDRPDASVTINGKPLPGGPTGMPVQADPGEHVFRFELAGAEPREERMVLHAGEKDRLVSVVMRLRESPRPMTAAPAPFPLGPVLAIGLSVLGAGALGAGEYFAVKSGNAADTAAGLRGPGQSPSACLNSTSSACQSLGDEVTAQHRDRNASTVLFITGGVLLVAALATWLFWPSGSSR